MIAFGWVTNILQRGMASWKRMLEVLDAVPGDQTTPRVTAAGRRRSTSAARIEIRDLTFAYPGTDTPVLRRRVAADRGRPDGRVRRRDRLRQVDADQPAAAPARAAARHGVHRRRGRAARFRSPTLRGAIGFVPQEPFLFSDTIAENIAFGVDDAGRGRLDDARDRAAAAAVARLDKDVADFPEGLRHDGRRARHHAVGRPEAAHRDRPRGDASIPRILILDDALSAVDTYTEEEILARLRGVMRAAHVDHRRRTASPRSATPIRSSSSTTAASSSAAARRAGRARRPLRRRCTGSSCSRRSCGV